MGVNTPAGAILMETPHFDNHGNRRFARTKPYSDIRFAARWRCPLHLGREPNEMAYRAFGGRNRTSRRLNSCR